MSKPNDIKDGGPAFPANPTMVHLGVGKQAEIAAGMSLRDWFAGKALSASNWSEWGEAEIIAQECYRLASAMLAEREKKNEL